MVCQIVFLDDPKPIDNSLQDTEQTADSVLASELLWNWSKGWYLNTALQYDASNERMVKSNVTLDYVADDKSLLQLNHRYSREVSDYEIEQVGFLPGFNNPFVMQCAEQIGNFFYGEACFEFLFGFR